MIHCSTGQQQLQPCPVGSLTLLCLLAQDLSAPPTVPGYPEVSSDSSQAPVEEGLGGGARGCCSFQTHSLGRKEYGADTVKSCVCGRLLLGPLTQQKIEHSLHILAVSALAKILHPRNL